MVEAPFTREEIRRVYDLWSFLYEKLAVPLERKPRLLGLERAWIQPNEKVLEVAVGPGGTLLEILKRVDRKETVYGVDLSGKMLARARRRVEAAGYTNFDLREADARQLPFADGIFDVLYNSYMFDLLPLGDMRVVLNEFRRVLKPGGRLVLVNLSKRDGGRLTWAERLYRRLPARWVPYLFGGCRPVLVEKLVKDAGFSDVTREFIAHLIPSEIVVARKSALGGQ